MNPNGYDVFAAITTWFLLGSNFTMFHHFLVSVKLLWTKSTECLLFSGTVFFVSFSLDNSHIYHCFFIRTFLLNIIDADLILFLLLETDVANVFNGLFPLWSSCRNLKKRKETRLFFLGLVCSTPLPNETAHPIMHRLPRETLVWILPVILHRTTIKIRWEIQVRRVPWFLYPVGIW